MRRAQLVRHGDDTDLRKVLTLIRKGGPLTIRDIDDDVLVEKNHPWASRKPSKRALQVAFYKGAVTISERVGMLKTYELMDRHFGWDARPRPASERQILDYLLERALRAQGLVSVDSVCHLDARRKPAIRRLIEAGVRRKELVPVTLEGAGKVEHWVRPEALDIDPEPAARAGAHPVPLRPPRHPAQAAAAVLRLRAPLRGLSAEGEAGVRLSCPAGADRRRRRRRHRSQDGSRASASCRSRNGPGWVVARTGRTSGRSRRSCTGSSGSSCIEHRSARLATCRLLTNAPLPPRGGLAAPRASCGMAATARRDISQAGFRWR